MSKKYVACVIAVALVACKGGGKGKPGETGGGGGAASEARGVQEKLAGYIECLNRHGGRILQIEGIYLDSVEGKAPTEKSNPNVITGYEIDDCVAALAKAKTQKPAMPDIEAAGDAFGKALQEVAPKLKEANEYYSQGNFKDDKMAKGIAMHEPLVAALEAFRAANGKLSDLVHIANRKAREEELAAREKAEGRNLGVVQDAMMMKAEELVRFADTPVTALDKLDLAAMTTDVTAFEAAVTELDKYVEAHADEAKQVSITYSMFVRNVKAYLKAAKDLMRRVRDKTPFSDGEKMTINANNEASVDGTPGQLMDRYNDLVDDYNRL